MTRAAYPRSEEWYDQRAGAGDTVLSVVVAHDSRVHQAMTIVESHHPVEMEESRDESSRGSAPLAADAGMATAGASFEPSSPTANEPSTQLRAASGDEEVIPLAEENLEVGKRTVDRGTTRVRRYVVETPVEREVTLHGERVTVERRKPAESGVPGHAFEERTVEVHETEEVPVVQKNARVVEEVAIRKEATDRTEKVSRYCAPGGGGGFTDGRTDEASREGDRWRRCRRPQFRDVAQHRIGGLGRY